MLLLQEPDKSVDVITEDNEVVDIIVNVLDNLTSESGDTGSFEINLTTEPLSDVFIELTSTNELEEFYLLLLFPSMQLTGIFHK